MTNAVQFSTKVGDDILVVGGANYAEFAQNFIQALGQEAFEATIGSFTAKVSATQSHAGVQQAVQTAQQGGIAPVNPGLSQNYGPRPDFVPQGVPLEAPPQQQYNGQQQVQQQPQQEYCNHGEKKWVPPGYSQAKQKAYVGFYACPAPRGQQCK